MQIRELIEMLEQFPPEMRLAFTVELMDGAAKADDVDLIRREDYIELRITGALACQLIPEGETK